MTPNEYQKLANRTICDQGASLERLKTYPRAFENMQVNHGLIGLAGEVGELCTAWQRCIYYGKGPLDKVNMLEELGDIMWYVAEICGALGLSLEDVMERNIAKLQKRYPDKYSDFNAAEENRDRDAERRLLEGKSVIAPAGIFEGAARKLQAKYQNDPMITEVDTVHHG